MIQTDIKCLFCDRFLESHHPANLHANCFGHGDLALSYHFTESAKGRELSVLTFIFAHPSDDIAKKPWTYHHLCLAFSTNKTSVYYFGNNFTTDKGRHLLFTIDHVIEGVTVQNAQQTLDRLLSLNVFS